MDNNHAFDGDYIIGTRSCNDGKIDTYKFIQANFKKDAKILDVGPGDGIYAKNLRAMGYTDIEACEAAEFYVKNFDLEKLYSKIHLCDIRKFIPEKEYDLVIFGDFLEHISLDEALKVLDTFGKSTNIVSVPWMYPQDDPGGLPWEIHVQDKLTYENVCRDYSPTRWIYSGRILGVFVKAPEAESLKTPRVGVTFPASTKESRISDIEDICRWYKALGFDRILFVNNGGMEDIRKLEFVEVIDDFSFGSQYRIMADGVKALGEDCDWVLACDSDEWLWPRTDIGVKEFLSRFPKNCGAVAINWVMFGNKNLRRESPCPEACIDTVPLENWRNKHVKCFVRPKAVQNFPSPHYPILQQGYSCLDENLFPHAGLHVNGTGIPLAFQHFTGNRFNLAHMWARSVRECVDKENNFMLDMGILREKGSILSDLEKDFTEKDVGFRDLWRKISKKQGS